MADDKILSDIISKDIIELLDLGDLPKEKQEEYRKLAIETVTNRTFARLTDILEEKKLLDDFEKVESTDQAIGDFLSKNEINFNDIVSEETVIYKAQMKTINDAISVGISVKPQE
jgi:hypothetical protein